MEITINIINNLKPKNVMRTEFIYSFMALGAIPITVNAADVQTINSDVLASTDGSKVTYQVGKLVPGKYKFTADVLSKVYGVTIKIGGQTLNLNNDAAAQNVGVEFTLAKETDIELTLESTDPGEAGAGFTVAGALVSLDFNFVTIKANLAESAQALADLIGTYNYAAKQEDVDAAKALKTKAEGIAESYDDYKKFKLYLGSGKTTIDDEIAALAEMAETAEAAYQNEQAYNRVNAEITPIKAQYNAAVAELEETLVGVAAYLLDAAKADLNENINQKITEATQASYTSYQKGTAVADELENIEKIPTEEALNAIVNNWKGQGATNQAAYDALHAVVTDLQADLDAIVPASDAIASVYTKTEAQAAIDAINTKVENAKNSAAQLSLNVDSDKAAAQGKINTLAGKVNTANNEFNANKSTTEAIAAVQTALDEAMAAVNAKVSKDGKYKAQDYYAKYVEDVQKEITALSTAATAAYKVDGTGTAVAYNTQLNTADIEAEIDLYQTNAIAAVEKYDALQDAINGVDEDNIGYQATLDAARAQFEGLAIYEAEGYDYKTKLDLIQKRINDIKKAITAAETKVGAEHWDAMIAIDADAAILTDIATLLAEKDAQQNQYDKDYLDNGLTELNTHISTFNTNATAAKLGADYQAFVDAEADIAAKKAAIEAEKAAVDPASVTAAATIQALGARIDALQAEQTALEDVAAVVAAKVDANGKAQTALAGSIDGLQTTIGTFKTTYKIGQDDSTLGNRGKDGGAVATEVSEIEAALNTLEGDNNDFDPAAVIPVDNTAKIDTTWGGLDAAANWAAPFVTPSGASEAIALREHYNVSSCQVTGTIISQEISGIENGIYDVVLYANACHANNVDADHAIAGDADDVAYVFANGKQVPIIAKKQNANPTNGEYTISNVIVNDGKLTIGLGKKKAGTNWHTIQIGSLTFHENDQLSAYNNVDPKPEEAPDTDGFNVKYGKLAAQVNALEEAAPGIKTAVENNAKANEAAATALTELGIYEVDNLKDLADVSNPDGSYNANAKQTANSNIYGAKKSNPANWYVFKSGLDADKTYEAKKAAIDGTIEAMTTAINNANAAETLPYPWNDEITVTVADDPSTANVDETSSTTYKISEIKALVDALKTEAVAESENYNAYRTLYSNTWNKLKPDTVQVTAERFGEGALAYYQGLKDGYIADKAAILTRMQASLNARTAVADKSGYQSEINAIIKKVKAIYGDGKANYQKYLEQKAAYEETQTLWNSTYTEIAATDKSSKAQDYLNELDAIQVTLTAATNAVEENYLIGKSVAEAKDFAAIKAAINDVKARQSESYNEFIAADNKAAHESFMGNETTKGQIQLATEAYQRAVQERAKYSSTNDEVKAAIDEAAAELDEALFNCPTLIAELTQAENEAYVATVSPAIFDVSEFNAAALAIQQNITNALNAFKATVKGQLEGFWTPTKNELNDLVTAAENDIDGYSDAAKTNAFKDVKDLIAAGDAAVNAIDLAAIEEAIAALENIETMLAADKDAAAEKDLNPIFAEVETKYGEVKAYIEGVTNDIAAKAEQLALLEAAYEALTAVKELDKNYENHNDIKEALDGFIATAGDCKTAVENAVAGDNANTEAYNEIIEALAPVEAKLAEAKAAAASYKYATSFGTVENNLTFLKQQIENDKEGGRSVSRKNTRLNRINTINNSINATLTTAFDTEKAGLANDITELKNQFNAYVAANGLNETATAFKKDIDDLEKALADAVILDDQDDPADGQYDEILEATAALVQLQNAIADKQSELLAANASTANAEVLADFQGQLTELGVAASLEGYDEWVGSQEYANTGKTFEEAIATLTAKIAAVKAAIEAEPNISFYKDQYQSEITQIQAILEPIVEAMAALDAQCKANDAAYATLGAQIAELQAKIDAAKAKVGAYEYAANTYSNCIEEYNDQEELIGGVQYWLNVAALAIEADNETKSLDEDSEVAYKGWMEERIQWYLNCSAYDELNAQTGNLYALLYNAVDAKHKAQTYSSALWGRLTLEQGGISEEIADLEYSIWNSYQTYETNRDYEAKLDENENYIAKERTSDADYAEQIAEVNRIKGEIADLSDAVDNLGLLGDANVDGKVNVLDYQKVLNMILDPTLQPEEDTELFTNIDINQSEVIEVGDLTAIVYYILNGDWQGYAAARRNLSMENESLAMNVTSLENGNRRIAVNLQNANAYTAFQMDMVLPDGMKMVGATLTDRAGESHKLYSRAQLDGSIRLLASSVKGESFGGNEGAVLYIDVEGAGNVELLNILFSDVNAQTRSFKLGDATGINTVSTFESLKQKVYDLGGRVKDGLKKGINIIRRADGTTQKVAK